MKKLLSLSAALLAVTAGFAQQALDVYSAPQVEVTAPDMDYVQYDNTTTSEATFGPKHSKATGLYYLAPAGMFRHWRPTTWNGYGNSIMLVPPFKDFACVNKAKDKANTLWFGHFVNKDPIEYRDWSNLVDENGDLVNSLNPGYYTVAPTLTNVEHTDSFILSRYNQYWIQEKYPTYCTRFNIADNDTLDWCGPFDDHLKTETNGGTLFFGYNSGTTHYYLMGTGEMLCNFTQADGTKYSEYGTTFEIRQQYPRPLTSFYTERMAMQIASTNVLEPIVAEGKHFYIEISNTETGEVLGTMASINESYVNRSTTTFGPTDAPHDVRYGTIQFEATQTDAFGNSVVVPIIIDCPYTVRVYGFDQEGVNVGFYGYKKQDQDNFPAAEIRLKMSSDGRTESQYYAAYSLPVVFKGVFDNTKVRTEASFYTDDTHTNTEIIGDLNIMKISDDGTECSNAAQSYAVVYTAFDWMDAEGTEYYYLLDENDEIPTWLNYTVDNSSYSSNKYSKIKFTAEPLPAGVAGRGVNLYAVSDKGAKSEVPILVYQGDMAAAGIEGVNITDVKTKNDNKIYNVLAQRVSSVQSGLYIKNGKKFIKK